MNNIEKQFQKQDRKKNNALRKWWRKNDYKVLRVLLFYIWIPCWAYDKIKDARYENLTYSNATTKKYLDKVMPKLVAHYEENPNTILFSDADDFGGITFRDLSFSSFMKKHFKKESKYFSKFNRLIKKYIIEEYQIDGYKKIVLDNWMDWNKAKEKFGWYHTPYNANYVKGIVFYKEA